MSDAALAEMLLYHCIERLFADYCACLEEDRLEDWPRLFVDSGIYRMVSRENHAFGFPIPLLLFEGTGMMRDRIASLRTANIYQAHRYRHAQSALRVTARRGEARRSR